MLLDEGLHVRKLKPDYGPRPLAVAHARDTDARKLPPLRQLVNKRKADFQNPSDLFCVKQLHRYGIQASIPLFFFIVVFVGDNG